VGKANSTLLPEMESEDEGTLYTICIKFVKLNVYILTFFFAFNIGELAINGATSVSDSGFEDDDF
jgi:hypothetical protein